MRASTKRALSILLAGVFFIATVVVYANLIQPEFAVVGEKRAEVFSKASSFDAQRAAVERVQELIAELQGARQLQDTVGLVLPVGPHVTEALHQIQTIARSSQVILTNFSVNQQAFEAPVQSLVRRLGVLQINLSAEGSYEGVRSFFKAVELNARVFTVQQLDITPASGSEGFGDNLFSGTATVEAYFQE
jgi:Tfp pilus assembly protein PilO